LLDPTGSCRKLSKNDNFNVQAGGCSEQLQFICAKSGELSQIHRRIKAHV
jgi:hypothetical protein